MKIEVEKISLDYFHGLKKDLNEKIVELKSKVYIKYSLNDFRDKSLDEIIAMLSLYDVNSVGNLSNEIYSFLKLEESNSDVLPFFQKNSSMLIEKYESKLEKLSEKNTLEKEKDSSEISSLEEWLDFTNNVIDILSGDVDSNKLEFVKKIIIESNFPDDVKFSFSFKLAQILFENLKNKKKSSFKDIEKKIDEISVLSDEKIEVEEVSNDELVENENIKFVKTYFKKYYDIFKNEEISSIDGLIDFFGNDEQMKDVINCEVIDKSSFAMLLSSLLFVIKQNEDTEKIDLYKNYLTILDNKFGIDKYFSRIENLKVEINDLLKFTAEKYKSLSKRDVDVVDGSLLSEYQSELFELEKRIKNSISENYMSISYIENYHKELSQLKKEIFGMFVEKQKEGIFEKEDGSKVVDMKSFVLFNYYLNDGVIVPYILTDLNNKSKNNFIDNGVEGYKLSSGYRDFNMLIEDYILLGNPRYLDSDVSSVSNESAKLCNRIYYDNNNDKYTGMLRIRTRKNSVLRFALQEITFKPGTKAFSQVCDIVNKHLPNVRIDNNKNFTFNFNVVSGFKRSDKELYTVAIDRKDNKKNEAIAWFIDNFKDKNELNDKECELFERIFVASLDALYKLREYHEELKFDIVEVMGGMKSHGK